MSNKNNKKNAKKAVRRDVKKILEKEAPNFAKEQKRADRRQDAGRAIRTYRKIDKNKPLKAGLSEMFGRAFTDRDAARLAWMLTVCDPFGKHNWSVPPVMGLGIPLSQPRIFRLTMRGFATANASGHVFIGANADMWLPDSFRATLTNAQPRFGFLGNNPVNGAGFRRGAPVHYTTSAYDGCVAATPPLAGSTGYSYPGPETTAATGLAFSVFPDSFITNQLAGDSTGGNAYQRCQNISVGLRVRPTAPASGALVPQGVLMMTQQTLGDTVQTNAAAASSSSAVGGQDCYAYLSGVFAGPNPNELTDAQIARQELDIMEWPRDKNKSPNWLSAAAIPNQSCCLAAYAPKTTGDRIVGYPQLAAVGAGMLSGQTIEWEASYVYAFYGSVSYEVSNHKGQAAVPMGDLSETVGAAASHMQVGSPHSPARQALASTVQTAVSAGEVKPSSAAKWIQGGKQVIETATGSSIGDLIGEGLGFLAGMLL